MKVILSKTKYRKQRCINLFTRCNISGTRGFAMPKKRVKKKRKEKRLNRKNEFGMTDLTPWEAVEKLRKSKRA